MDILHGLDLPSSSEDDGKEPKILDPFGIKNSEKYGSYFNTTNQEYINETIYNDLNDYVSVFWTLEDGQPLNGGFRHRTKPVGFRDNMKTDNYNYCIVKPRATAHHMWEKGMRHRMCVKQHLSRQEAVPENVEYRREEREREYLSMLGDEEFIQNINDKGKDRIVCENLLGIRSWHKVSDIVGQQTLPLPNRSLEMELARYDLPEGQWPDKWANADTPLHIPTKESAMEKYTEPARKFRKNLAVIQPASVVISTSELFIAGLFALTSFMLASISLKFCGSQKHNITWVLQERLMHT